MIQLPKTYI